MCARNGSRANRPFSSGTRAVRSVSSPDRRNRGAVGRVESSMRRLLAGLACSLTVAASSVSAPNPRPVILLVHGRGLQDRDSAGVRRQWIDALHSGAATLTRSPTFDDSDVRVVWYADVLDPKSADGCEYDPGDLRARRDAKTDAQLKQVVAFAGGFINFVSAFADDSVAKSIRTLAADASFLGDIRKRCASEARLGAAIDRAKREGRPVIVVAHSLGALVAYDYL